MLCMSDYGAGVVCNMRLSWYDGWLVVQGSSCPRILIEMGNLASMSVLKFVSES